MRFRRSTARPPYLNRVDQRRLLVMVGLLVLVLVGMRLAANPNAWNWLFVGQNRKAADEKRRERPRSPSSRPQAPPRALPLKPGEFRAQATAGGDRSRSAVAAGPVAAKRPRPSLRVSAGTAINPRDLGRPEDGVGLTYRELDAYYAVLAKAAKVPPRKLRRIARNDVSYTMLMDSPDEYRGAVVSLEGRLGSLKRLPGTRRELGLGTLYEAWIVTPASARDPYRVVISELPDGLVPQDLYETPPHVRAVGYFFKVQNYAVNEQRDHLAPLLLAKRIEPVPAEELQSPGLGIAPWVIGAALALGAVLAFTMWRFSAGDRQFARERLRQYERERDREAAGLNALPAGDDADEFFKRLSEEASEGGPGDKASG